MAEADTSHAALASYAGMYESAEADATLRIAFDSTGTLAVSRVSTTGGPWRLRPIYRDGFTMVSGVLVFTRDGRGRVNGFRFTTARVRNLRFERTAEPPTGLD